jgi:hypothetical protein
VVVKVLPLLLYFNYDMSNTESKIQGEILLLESDLANAVLNRNRSVIENILADDFIAVGHVGNVVNKNEYLDIHLAPERQFVTFETREQMLKILGEFVYVTGSIIVATKEIRNHSRYVTINQKIGQNWQIVFWQETPITDDKF